MRVTPLPIFGAKWEWKTIKRDKSTSRDFVARGRPLRGQTMLAPLAKRSTCSKSTLAPETTKLDTIEVQVSEVTSIWFIGTMWLLSQGNVEVFKRYIHDGKN